MSSIDLGDQVVPVENTQRLRNGDDNRDVARLARSAQGKRAAAFATANLVSSFLENGTPAAQAKAAEVLQEIANDLEGAPVTQPQPELVLPGRVEAPVEPEPVAVPTDYELPADLEALLEEPEEFEYEEEQPVPVADEAAVVDDDEYVDPQVLKLRRELEKERKRTEHERKLRVQTARKDWEAEAARVFALGTVPLLDNAELAGIKAESKREFMRQAKALADRNKAVAQRFQPTAPAPVVVPREQTAEAWGEPPAATSTAASADSVAQQQRLARARRSGNLSAIFKAQLFPDATD